MCVEVWANRNSSEARLNCLLNRTEVNSSGFLSCSVQFSRAECTGKCSTIEHTSGSICGARSTGTTESMLVVAFTQREASQAITSTAMGKVRSWRVPLRNREKRPGDSIITLKGCAGTDALNETVTSSCSGSVTSKGDPMRAPAGVSGERSKYCGRDEMTGGSFTSSTATWIVPTVSRPPPSRSVTCTTYSSTRS